MTNALLSRIPTFFSTRQPRRRARSRKVKQLWDDLVFFKTSGLQFFCQRRQASDMVASSWLWKLSPTCQGPVRQRVFKSTLEIRYNIQVTAAAAAWCARPATDTPDSALAPSRFKSSHISSTIPSESVSGIWFSSLQSSVNIFLSSIPIPNESTRSWPGILSSVTMSGRRCPSQHGIQPDGLR